MTYYLMSIQQPYAGAEPPADLDEIMAEVDALNREMKEAGAWVFGGGLHAPETATVLHYTRGDSDVMMTDGPYTEGKEHVGGLSIIRAADLDEALEWGRRLAKAIRGLPIEVRPFMEETGG